LERAPAGAVARDLVGGEPLAVDVAAEVRAGVLGGVELVGAEAVDRRQVALVEGQRVGIGGRCGIGAVGSWSGVLVGAGGDDGGDGKGQQQDLRFVHVWLRPERHGEDGPDGCRDRTTLNHPGPAGGRRRSRRETGRTTSRRAPDDSTSLDTDGFWLLW